jgi:hypothetical protein
LQSNTLDAGLVRKSESFTWGTIVAAGLEIKTASA